MESLYALVCFALTAWSGGVRAAHGGRAMAFVHCMFSIRVNCLAMRGIGGQPLQSGCHGNPEFFIITKVSGLEWPQCTLK